MSQLMDTLKVAVLIGWHQNEYITQVIQVSLNPFDQIMIPDDWIPNIKLQFGTLIAKWTSDLIYNSGFEI